MNRLSVASLLSALLLASASSRIAPAQAPAPVAFVYVSNTPNNSSTNNIRAYTAAANGALTPVVGSPYADNVTSMAVNGKYLFGSTQNGVYVAAFTIEPNGALKWSNSTNVVAKNPSDCGYSGPLFLDHTGATLYDMEFDSDCSNNSYLSLAVVKASGHLTEMSTGPSSFEYYPPATFIGNNVYAYAGGCDKGFYGYIAAFKRGANGVLSTVNAKTPIPAQPSNIYWCPMGAAADPTNHVAIAVQEETQGDFVMLNTSRLITYTAAANGNLATTSTNANMPTAIVGTVSDLKMAPSGKLLAVSGTSGLQVFHYNGAAPATKDTGLLVNTSINQIFWDNANHLYAISNAAGKLYAFTVTPTSAVQAPGSPYTIQHPQNLIVQPRTKPIR